MKRISINIAAPLRLCALLCLLLCSALSETVARPDTSQKNKSYISNRAPLLPSPLIKLPIGSIEPQGWLRKQLEHASFEVAMKDWPANNNVWRAATAPIEIKTQGRRIPGWQTDETDLVGLMSESPVKSDEPVEEITLIPMGAARLRLSAFPVIDNGPEGHPWKTPPEPIVKITPRQAAAMKKAAAGEQNLDVLNPSAKKIPKGGIPKGATAEVRAKTFARWDTDHNGVVTLAEYLAGQKASDLLEARFKHLDKNADGKLTLGEFIGPPAK